MVYIMNNKAGNWRLWKDWILGLGLIFFAFFQVGCQSPEKQRLLKYYSSGCSHVDSIWKFYAVDNDPIKYVQNICNATNFLERKGLLDSCEKLINYMEGFAQKTDNVRYKDIHYLNRAFHCLNVQLIDSAWHYYTVRQKYAANSDDVTRLMSHNFAGCFYYNVGEVDSARTEFVNGYNLSKEIGDTMQCFSLALNAGATHHALEMFGAASYYFSEAYSIALRRKNITLLLVNNLVASLISEKKYDRALELCNEYKIRWMNEPNDHGSKLLRLNYCHLLSIKQLFVECEKNLQLIDPAAVPKEHLGFYYSIVLNQKLHVNQDAAAQFLDTLDLYMYQNQPQSVVDMHNELSYASEKGLFSLSLDSITMAYQRFAFEKNWSPSYRSKYEGLIANILNDRGDLAKAKSWQLKQIISKEQLELLKDSVLMSDIDEQIDQTVLKNQLNQKQFELEKRSGRNNFLSTLLVSFAIVILALAILFVMFAKNKKRKLAIIDLERKLVAQELQILKQEKEMKENVFNVSQTVLQQVAKLSDRLRTASFARDPEAISIRLDIDRLNQLSETLSEPVLSESIYDSYDYLFEEMPSLLVLSNTERKVLVLSILGNRPREISALLDINDQYVRNVKSKIKKLLPVQSQNLDWTDFKRRS